MTPSLTCRKIPQCSKWDIRQWGDSLWPSDCVGNRYMSRVRTNRELGGELVWERYDGYRIDDERRDDDAESKYRGDGESDEYPDDELGEEGPARDNDGSWECVSNAGLECLSTSLAGSRANCREQTILSFEFVRAARGSFWGNRALIRPFYHRFGKSAAWWNFHEEFPDHPSQDCCFLSSDESCHGFWSK